MVYSDFTEGIQLKKLNTHRIKAQGCMCTCGGPLQSPNGVDETCGPWAALGQAMWRGHGTGREADLS